MDSKKQSSEHGWHEQAEACKREAEKLPYGRAREGCCARPGNWRPRPASTNGCPRRGCRHRSDCLFWFVRGTIIGLL